MFVLYTTGSFLIQERTWERKAAMREWDLGKNEKSKETEKHHREERPADKRRHRSPEASPEPGLYLIYM